MHESGSSETAGPSTDGACGVGLGRGPVAEASPAFAPPAPVLQPAGRSPEAAGPPSPPDRPAGSPSDTAVGAPRPGSPRRPRREQRASVRVPLDLPLTLTVLDPAGLPVKSLAVTVLEISASGASVALPEPLWEGCPVRLALRCDAPAVDLPLLATVIRVTRIGRTGHSAGLRFVALGPDDRVTLTRFVLRQARVTGHGSAPVVSR